MDWACSQFFGVLYYGLFSFGKGRGPSNPLSVCAFFFRKSICTHFAYGINKYIYSAK